MFLLKKYNFTQFANIIAGHFQLGLLVGKFSYNSAPNFKKLCSKHCNHLYITCFHFFIFHQTLLVLLMRWSSVRFHQRVQGLFLNWRTWGYVVQFFPSFFNSGFYVIHLTANVFMFTNCMAYGCLIYFYRLCNLMSIMDYMVILWVSFVYNSGQLLSCTLW